MKNEIKNLITNRFEDKDIGVGVISCISEEHQINKLSNDFKEFQKNERFDLLIRFKKFLEENGDKNAFKNGEIKMFLDYKTQ